MITPVFHPPRSILDECFGFSLMSFRSSAVLMTTPFWSGISWTSQPMASQRGGLPPAPTRIFLDSRYKSKSYLSNRLLNACPVCLRPQFDCRLFCSLFTHRWRHLPHLFLEEPWADWVMLHPSQKGAYLFFLYPRHLSVHFASASSSSPVLMDSRACAHCLSMTCTHTHLHAQVNNDDDDSQLQKWHDCPRTFTYCLFMFCKVQ